LIIENNNFIPKGLGKEFAKILLENGAKVCISDIKEEELELTFKEFQDLYGSERVCFVKCDVTIEEEFNCLFDETERFFECPCIDVLVNNAGIGMNFGWKKCLEVNLVGMMQGCEIAMNRMKNSSKSSTGKKSIINISSMSGIIARGGEDVMGYTVSKHGIIALTKTLAEDIKYHGIIFKVLCPAWVDTDLVSTLRATMSKQRLPELEKQIQKVGGLMTTEYVAKGFYKLFTECENGTVMWVLKDTPYIIMPNDALTKVLIGVGIAKIIGKLSDIDIVKPLHQKLFFGILFVILIICICQFT
jgi:NAD(P)-dependent dehydrogenase (short-subunit alcohol dehydrogenase family)